MLYYYKFYLFVLLKICLVTTCMILQTYETQPYKVISQQDSVELRYYPPALKVKIRSHNPRQHFSKLFSYISGQNSSQTKIAMTTPVYMQKTNKTSEMAFVLPASMALSSSPKPSDPNVQVVEDAGGYYCAITYNGYTNVEKEKKYSAQLMAFIQQKNWIIQSEPYILSYDSPFKFYNRTNEVLIQIENPNTPNKALR